MVKDEDAVDREQEQEGESIRVMERGRTRKIWEGKEKKVLGKKKKE